MMKLFYKLLFVALALSLFSNYLYAQTDTAENKKNTLKIGLNYINNDVYLGRADTVITPTLIPSITYTLTSGLYFSASLDYITNRKKNKLDGGSLEAGYNYTVGENFEGGISFTKLFYSTGSTQVSSSLSGIFNAYVDYDIAGIITPTLSISYNMNKGAVGSDFLFSPNLSHDFEIEGIFTDDDELKISPQAGLNLGSQNFYAGYLERKGRINRKGANAAYTAYNNSLANFTSLDSELSLPLEYKSGRLIFTFTPSYAFASDSLPKSTITEKLITQSIETGAPYKPGLFYFEMGFSLNF